jgi:hypothetical protein
MNDVKITKLPPGEAKGARDLQEWAHNRAQGYSGVRGERVKESAGLRSLTQHGDHLNYSKARKRKRVRLRKEREELRGRVTVEVDGVQMVAKAGSKPPKGTRVSYFGPPCPGCGSPSQVREHERIGHKQLSKHFYLQRRFFCITVDCRTRGFSHPGDRVWNAANRDAAVEHTRARHAAHSILMGVLRQGQTASERIPCVLLREAEPEERPNAKRRTGES